MMSDIFLGMNISLDRFAKKYNILLIILRHNKTDLVIGYSKVIFGYRRRSLWIIQIVESILLHDPVKYKYSQLAIYNAST